MAETRTKLPRMRKMIGDAMLKSITTIPQASGFTTVDCTGMLNYLARMEQEGHKISSTVYLCKCVAMALELHPNMNARLEGDEVIVYDSINAGIGVDMGDSLIVVVLKDLQKKPILEINDQFHELMGRVKAKKITMDDITGGTFTISNMSKRTRYSAFNSIVTNNEAFILGMSGIIKQVVVDENDNIVIRPCTNLIMNINHTLVDGATSTRFSTQMYDFFENPDEYLY